MSASIEVAGGCDHLAADRVRCAWRLFAAAGLEAWTCKVLALAKPVAVVAAGSVRATGTGMVSADLAVRVGTKSS
jgi:hypothetical protein